MYSGDFICQLMPIIGKNTVLCTFVESNIIAIWRVDIELTSDLMKFPNDAYTLLSRTLIDFLPLSQQYCDQV